MHRKDPIRQQRSLRCCHLPAEEQPLHAPPRNSGAYVPELAARIDDDRNLSDGARRCARKLTEYVYRINRAARAAEITVTWLMKALGRSRRTVQRYLRQLERAGYIGAEVIHTLRAGAGRAHRRRPHPDRWRAALRPQAGGICLPDKPRGPRRRDHRHLANEGARQIAPHSAALSAER